MKAISFELSGKTACFRKPDVNQFAYFTYNNIHKVALLGLLGAIIGLGGYTKLHYQKELLKEKIKGLKEKEKKVFEKELSKLEDKYPEFYEKLKELKISIVPLAPCGYFSKKIQVFNNSVGYASQEEGGNLIVREQWLENPAWQIMILDDGSKVYKRLKEYLLNKKSAFIPYLGKNDHPANIDEVKEVELKRELFVIDDEIYIDSLFPKGEDLSLGWVREDIDAPEFLFQEVSPVSLQKEYHFYEYKTMIFTSKAVDPIPKDTYSYENKNYTFI